MNTTQNDLSAKPTNSPLKAALDLGFSGPRLPKEKRIWQI
jgi:hypothetical protein